MQPNTQKKWLAIVEQQKQSTLTIKEFCTQLKISPSTFYQRKRELTTLDIRRQLTQSDTSFIKASITQTVDVEMQAPPILLTLGKANLTFPQQTTPQYLAALIKKPPEPQVGSYTVFPFCGFRYRTITSTTSCGV